MRPPRLASWFIRKSAPNHAAADSILGDLFQEYRQRRPVIRYLWYWWHAGRIALGYFPTRFHRRNRIERGETFASTGRDLRTAFHMWRRRPGLALLVAATLGLGIGATTAIVSVVDRVMLRSLPYPDAHELVTVWNTYPTWRGHEVLDAFWDEIALSYPEYVDWRDGSDAFKEVAIYTAGLVTLTGKGDPSRIGMGTASSTLFPLLGAEPHLGRNFSADEEGVTGTRVAIVSHGFWVTQLGSQENLGDQFVTLDSERYQVVGVLPRDFRFRSLRGFDDSPDVWVPAGIFGNANRRGNHRFESMARLADGVSIQQAEADAGPLLRGDKEPERQGVRVLGRQAEETRTARGPLMMLLLAAGVLMLIAAVNVATLFTAEASNRRHEFATRSALGASGARLARQLVFESGWMGLLGAGIGMVVAAFGVRGLLTLAPDELSLPASVPLDARLLFLTAAFGIAVSIVFGVIPSLIVSRGSVGAALNRRSVTGHRTTLRMQRGLIAIEAALSVVLLVGAALLGRTLMEMQAVDPGFQPENLVAMSLPLSGQATQNHLVIQLAHDLRRDLSALPGVGDVTAASIVPFSGLTSSSSFEIVGREASENDGQPEAHRRSVLPGYFETLGIPLLAGRFFEAQDRDGGRPVVIVSQALVDQYWPGENPIGEYLRRDNQDWEIVGVVGDVLNRSLTETHQSTFYFPFEQQPPFRFWVVLRSVLPVDLLVQQARDVVTARAPAVAIGRVEPLTSFVRESTAGARYRAALVAVFGVCSLVLAAVGIFGLTARMITARRKELGIRLALGAQQAAVTRTVMATEAVAVGVGIVAGLGLTLVGARWLESFLFGVSPRDPVAFVGAALSLALVGVMASYIPARRTGRIDPIETLRAE